MTRGTQNLRSPPRARSAALGWAGPAHREGCLGSLGGAPRSVPPWVLLGRESVRAGPGVGDEPLRHPAPARGPFGWAPKTGVVRKSLLDSHAPCVV